MLDRSFRVAISRLGLGVWGLVCFGLCGCQSRSLTNAEIEGVSMAPALWGEHLSTTCGECGYPYQCDARSLEPTNASICPNCGFTGNSREGHRVEPPHRYVVETDFGRLHRWEVVAFHYPADTPRAGQLGVKRVVGLPGETISIRDGIIWNHEGPIRMTWEQIQVTMIPVFDSRYIPPASAKLPGRFRPQRERSGWRQGGNSWSFRPLPGIGNELDSISYEHWRCCRHTGDRTQVFPIEDYHPGDQSIFFQPHLVNQLYVAIELEMNEQAFFQVVIVRPNGKWTVQIQGNTSQVLVNFDGRDAATARIDPGTLKNGVLEISTIGGTLHALWNGKKLGGPWDDPITNDVRANGSQNSKAIDSADVPTSEVNQAGRPVGSQGAAIEIGASHGPVLVRRIRICRGIHYRDELNPDGSIREYALGQDEYLVIGDNVNNSVDSRNWNPHGLSKRSIIGTVKPIVRP